MEVTSETTASRLLSFLLGGEGTLGRLLTLTLCVAAGLVHEFPLAIATVYAEPATHATP